MEHSAGPLETLEMLNGMLYSFDHPEQSSAEQGRTKLCALGEMLDSFEQGLRVIQEGPLSLEENKRDNFFLVNVDFPIKI